MRLHSSFLFGSFALVASLTACGDDSGGGGAGGETGSSTSGSTATSGGPGATSSSSSKASSSSGGDGGDGTGATGAGGPGTGGDEPAGTGGDGTGGTGAGTGGDTGAGGDGTGGGQGCDGVELTVKNYLSWCDVSVAGIAPFGGAQQVVCVPEGETALSATPHEGFALGDDMWHHTDGDLGDGEAGDVDGDVSSTTVTVSGTADCVWVCCPFENGTGCDVSDQCE